MYKGCTYFDGGGGIVCFCSGGRLGVVVVGIVLWGVCLPHVCVTYKQINKHTSKRIVFLHTYRTSYDATTRRHRFTLSSTSPSPHTPHHTTLQPLRHCIFTSPLSRSFFVPGSIRFVNMGNLRDKRVIRVGISEQRTDGEQDLRDRESRGPLFFQNIEANTALAVDIRVVHLGLELDLGWLEGVIGGEVNGDKENTAAVWRVPGAHNSCLQDGGVRVGSWE